MYLRFRPVPRKATVRYAERTTRGDAIDRPPEGAASSHGKIGSAIMAKSDIQNSGCSSVFRCEARSGDNCPRWGWPGSRLRWQLEAELRFGLRWKEIGPHLSHS